MTVEVLGPRDIQTTLNYYTPLDSQPPYNYDDEPPAGVPRSNFGRDVRSVVIHDARGKDETLGLDASGFQFVRYPSFEKDFVDEGKIKSAYYPEVEDILKKHAGAKRVFIFDHTVRWSSFDRKGPSTAALRGPIRRVHADQTFTSAPGRVEYHLGDEAKRLLKGRYRIINVWRPTANPVGRKRLAVVDYRTVDVDKDLVSTRHIYTDREGATFSVKYNPGHKWYYLSDQTPDEVTLFKCFDSDVDKARLAPHTAFYDNRSPTDVPQRQSIEVRALVFDTE